MRYNLTEKEKKAKDYVCLALDLNNRERILETVEELWDLVGYFKLNSAFTFFGPELVKEIINKGGKVFLDLKYHDIPNTVGLYAEACTKIGVSILNMHVAGGTEMMRAAVKKAEEAAKETGIEKPKLIGMTVMTSINKEIMNNELCIPGEVEDQVLKWARLAQEAGLDGIVCSAADLDAVKDNLPEDFFYITPGVRPAGVSHDDQKRVFTPGNAVKAGSSLLVIGRAILKAEDRRRAAYETLQDIAKVL